MRPQYLTYNELIIDVLRREFPDQELAELFCGKFDQPIQAALRDRKSLRVMLVDMHRDGTFGNRSRLSIII